jgi:tricarballylate dehydrogenase
MAGGDGARVVVVGAGAAGLCAALAAAEGGAHVTVLERAPESERGGNTAFSVGAMLVAYDSPDQLLELMTDLAPAQREVTDFGTYTEADFFDDMARVTEYRADPELVEVLVGQSHETLRWMVRHGVEFQPMYGMALQVEGRLRFVRGLAIGVRGRGAGLVDALAAAAAASGGELAYGMRAERLLTDDRGQVCGVRARRAGELVDLPADAVVLASGGFQANAKWRTRYLGPGWGRAKVRGSRFNTGDGIRLALEAGAMPYGDWSGCHAVSWDRNAPDFGDASVGDDFQKLSYQFGIMVNAAGQRFVDEGADFGNYTYARYGRAILEQPGQVAWQVFDQKVTHLLREEYRTSPVTKVVADSPKELAARLQGVDGTRFLETLDAYNKAVRVDVPFDPAAKDGRRADLRLPKSNWANRIDVPPFEAYQVTCGITFTFGGVRVNPSAQVVDAEGQPLPGLFACGEMVGGLFYLNYPGGSGLTAASVFGRIAGASAAAVSQR